MNKELEMSFRRTWKAKAKLNVFLAGDILVLFLLLRLHHSGGVLCCLNSYHTQRDGNLIIIT